MSEHSIRALERAIEALVKTQSKLGERLARSTATLEKLPAMMADQSQVVARALAEQTRLLAELEVARAEAATAGKRGQLAAERAHLEEKRARLKEDGEVIQTRNLGVQNELSREADRRVRELDGEAFALVEKDFTQAVVANYSELYGPGINQLRAHYARHIDLRSALLQRAVEQLVQQIELVEARVKVAQGELKKVLLRPDALPEGDLALSVWRTLRGHRETYQVHSVAGLGELDPAIAERIGIRARGEPERPMTSAEVEQVADLMERGEPRGGAVEAEWPQVVEEIRGALAAQPPRVFSGGEGL